MKPVLVFDGDCGFCKLWIARCRRATGDKVDYQPYQTAAAHHKEVPREAFTQAIHFFEPGRTTRAAEAAFRALSYAPRLSWLPRVYALPLVAPTAEAAYRVVAARRPLFSRLTRLLWGETPVPASLAFTSRLVSAGLGACYLLAFISLGTQIRGLIGSDGIMPAGAMLVAAKSQLGPSCFWLLPSIAWVSASDGALTAYCVLGGAASLAMIFGFASSISAFVCWALYLSLSAIGSDFMSFQWDVLLLEAGLIACFLPSRGAIWLLRFLLIKLMVQSGLVKLFSGDPAWRNFTALTYHYWTQPLPTPIAWWFDKLPLWFHKISCGVLFAIELVAPITIPLPRRLRAAGALAIATLMVLIAATGNYGFFNLLTIVLCIACLDDRFFNVNGSDRVLVKQAPSMARKSIFAAIAACSLTIGVFETLSIVGVPPPSPIRWIEGIVSPFRSFNRYGLFAVMTKSRHEIAIEISLDGSDWREWPFGYKPSDPRRAPPWVAPHMPRVDWQMWFASLSEPSDSPWFANLLFRILDGSSPATALLGPNPLGREVRPLYARAVRYETAFSTRAQRRADGSWWTRTRKGLYFPVVSLKR